MFVLINFNKRDQSDKVIWKSTLVPERVAWMPAFDIEIVCRKYKHQENMCVACIFLSTRAWSNHCQSYLLFHCLMNRHLDKKQSVTHLDAIRLTKRRNTWSLMSILSNSSMQQIPLSANINAPANNASLNFFGFFVSFLNYPLRCWILQYRCLSPIVFPSLYYFK